MEQTVKMMLTEFDDLLDYSFTEPAAVVIGKRWKSQVISGGVPQWYLCEYMSHPLHQVRPGYRPVVWWRAIEIVSEVCHAHCGDD